MAKRDERKAPEKPSLAELFAKQDPVKLQQLMTTLAVASTEAQGLMVDLMRGNTPAAKPDPFGLGKSMARFGQTLAVTPDKLIAANMKLWQGYMQLGMGAMTPQRDKRFSDPEWSANPMFDLMRKAYQLNTDWLMSLVDSAGDMPEADRRKLKFFTQQTADAFAPTNFLATNPAAMRSLLETGGQSVLSGLKRAREDVRKNDGKLLISQTDGTPFAVGENIATAPGQVVYRNTLIELIQYAPTTETVHSTPLVIFPPWINKFYILDLREENSMIRWLVDKGLTVFVVSWRSGCEETKDFTWDDYITEGIHAAVDAASKACGVKSVNTVGYCIGGTLLSGALAHMAKTGDKRIKAATFFASQSDFEKAGDLLVFTDETARAHIDTVIDENGGIMPGAMMYETFNWLRPVDLVWRYVIDQYMLGKEPRPFDLLYWNSDQTNIPGPVHRTYLRDFYGKNMYANGRFKVLGESVDPADVEIPVMVQASRDDHICPYESVYRTAQMFSGKTEFVMAGSGHIAGVVNHPDANKYQHWTNKALPGSADEWLNGATQHAGSWWPYWWKWLKPKSGKKVSARDPKKVKGLPAAPGDYVKTRLSDIPLPL